MSVYTILQIIFVNILYCAKKHQYITYNIIDIYVIT